MFPPTSWRGGFPRPIAHRAFKIGRGVDTPQGEDEKKDRPFIKTEGLEGWPIQSSRLRYGTPTDEKSMNLHVRLAIFGFFVVIPTAILAYWIKNWFGL